MKLQCHLEQDLLDAVAAGRWPDRADPPLREHVHGCAICRDAAVFAAAFLEDREAAWAEAAVPPASVVWWRAQLRAREEAARLAARPIVVVQAIATLCVFVVSAAMAPAASEWVRQLIVRFGASELWSVPRELDLSWIVGAAAYTTLPLLAVGLWLVLAPVVVYLALDE